jgi:hypothetical protein
MRLGPRSVRVWAAPFVRSFPDIRPLADGLGVVSPRLPVSAMFTVGLSLQPYAADVQLLSDLRRFWTCLVGPCAPNNGLSAFPIARVRIYTVRLVSVSLMTSQALVVVVTPDCLRFAGTACLSAISSWLPTHSRCLVFGPCCLEHRMVPFSPAVCVILQLKKPCDLPVAWRGGSRSADPCLSLYCVMGVKRNWKNV